MRISDAIAENLIINKNDLLRIRCYAGGRVQTIYDYASGDKNYSLRFTDRYNHFRLYNIVASKPSFVDVMFAVTDSTHKGVDDLKNPDFIVRENGSNISASESFRHVQRMNQVPFKIVLMIDNSVSIINDLEKVKQSAKQFVNKIRPNQQMAVYVFSDLPYLLQDFTADTTMLQQAISKISLGFPSTNLFGSMITALSRWTDEFSQVNFQQGAVVLFTDGDDTQGSSTLNQVISARGQKKVYVIGLGNNLTPTVLNQISYPQPYMPINSIADLENTFTEIQADIVRYSNSFYWLNYMSPKRTGTHALSVSTTGNINPHSTSSITGDYSANGFLSVTSGVYFNISDTKIYGIDSVFCFYDSGSYNFTLSRYGSIFSRDSLLLKPTTYWAFKQPVYNWSLGITQFLKLDKGNYSTMVLRPIGGDTITNTLNIHDQANNYTKQLDLQMHPEHPILKIEIPENITGNSADFKGVVLNEGRLSVLSRGFVWNTSPNPTVSLATKTNSGKGKGSLITTAANLKTGTKYYVRAYSTNSSKTYYSTELTFNTNLGLPELTTKAISSITATSANSGGNITHDGGATITARGVCWSTSANPTIADNITTNGTGSESFTSFLSNLKSGTTYYVRAYATNSQGTSYGNSITFKTLNSTPELTTTSITDITENTAKSGGIISHDGGAAVTARGVVWSTNPNPTIALITKTTVGSGLGSFTSTLTGLKSGTSYYVRAYATNSIGTAYGENQQFTTTLGLPEITTAAISSITFTSANSGGIITHDGGSPITSRGVCWSTSPNPTIEDSRTTNGIGLGSFGSSITGLNSGNTYYVRAYATNKLGVSYGNQLNFTRATTVTSTTGKVWMDRNIGAYHVASSSDDEQAYGDLYQWGRGTDGHEKRTSQTISTISSSNTPGHGNFITTSSNPYDWRNPQNNNLWQGVYGTNNPCPEGFRIPTAAEWDAERTSWSSKNSAGAFASPLKLPVAGYRDNSNGSLGGVGSHGVYWSSNVNGTFAQYLYFYSGNAAMNNYYRADGNSVRCLKD